MPETPTPVDAIRSAAQYAAGFADLESDADAEVKAFPWPVLVDILVSLLPRLLELCPRNTAADFKAACRRPGILARRRVRREVERVVKAESGNRRQLGWAAFDRLCDRVEDAVFAAGEDAPLAEVESLRSAVLGGRR